MKGGSAIRWLGIGTLATVVAGTAFAAWRAAERRPVFPAERWSWKAPEAAGFSAAKLQAFSAKAGGIGCLVHGGDMIHAWGDVAFRGDVASSAKPIYAYLVFKALEEGRIGSLDDRVERWAPEIRELNGQEGYPDRDITFRHLLSQTSGYGLEERPGEAFAYNDYATALLAWTVFHRVYECPRGLDDAVLNGDLLGKAIGFEDAPTVVHRHSRPYRVRISARDQARFALLYLRGGEWDGQRLLSEDLFRQALGEPLPLDFPRTSSQEAEMVAGARSLGGGRNEKHHLGCLGGYWWHNRVTPDGTRLLPDAPPGTFFGSGHGGRFAMIVMPELDLIAVWADIYEHEDWTPLDEIGRHRLNETIRELLAARIEAKP